MNIPCATCGYPASCLRSSEVNVGEPACDTCCGHDAEDVVCVPLGDVDVEALKAFEEVKT